MRNGPPSADVKAVEMIQEKQGVSDAEVKQVLGNDGRSYEVREYRGN